MTEIIHLGELADVPWFKQNMGEKMVKGQAISRGKWQSTDEMGSQADTFELSNFIIEGPHHPGEKRLIEWTGADMPWANEHFYERVGGKPLNPPPSEARWPWHSAAKDKFKDDDAKYDHTYPERMWPTKAGTLEKGMLPLQVNYGIRFEYGDLNDVVRQLREEPFTRQAYLPIWFPEDTGKTDVRVPCTLGYHFIRNGPYLDVNYFIRSCDMTRHLSNDIYFTYMLLEWVAQRLCEPISETEWGTPYPGKMTMFISNLHILRGDAWRYQ